jgi:clan AA aspartic protease
MGVSTSKEAVEAAPVAGGRWSRSRRRPVSFGHMGLSHVRSTLWSPSRPRRRREIRFLIDSGAVYSVLPEKVWKDLELTPARAAEFTLADGTTIERGVAECVVQIAGRKGTSPVVLGGPKDEALLGAVTLEVLGLMLNPLSRELLPMKLVLARVRA